jgi:hypothetical protein
MKIALLGAAAALSLGASAAEAVVVQWADLTSSTANSVNGSIAVGSDNVSVEYQGPVFFAQTNGGTNYWVEGNPRPYTGGIVENAPGTPDIIALSAGGAKTIKFGKTVSDVYLALVSWNGNSGIFDQPFEVISSGCGFWGCGGFANVTPNSFTATGELHGVIRFTGAFDQVTFTDQTEGWHGIQVGIGGVFVPPPPPGVPEPAAWALMIAGFGLAGSAMRRRTTKVVFA